MLMINFLHVFRRPSARGAWSCPLFPPNPRGKGADLSPEIVGAPHGPTPSRLCPLQNFPLKMSSFLDPCSQPPLSRLHGPFAVVTPSFSGGSSGYSVFLDSRYLNPPTPLTEFVGTLVMFLLCRFAGSFVFELKSTSFWPFHSNYTSTSGVLRQSTALTNGPLTRPFGLLLKEYFYFVDFQHIVMHLFLLYGKADAISS